MISRVKAKYNRHDICVTFRNKSWLLLTKTTYVSFKVFDGKLYFKESDKLNGIKITGAKKGVNCHTRNFRVSDQLLPLNNGVEIGEYALLKDNKYNLYYIGVNTKL